MKGEGPRPAGVDDFDRYLSGAALYGDDFSELEIGEWFVDEAEAYAELGAKNAADYRYGYHAWNIRHGFRHLPPSTFDHALGFGAAYGDEFEPVLSRIRRITIVDPSSAFERDSVGGVPVTYLKPEPSGRLPLPPDEFDLITCFGVLPHIPNVSAVVRELGRVLAPSGFMLLREDIHSLGDWRRPRVGVTKRQRGIPLPILHSIVASSGLRVLHEALCDFALTPRLFSWVRTGPYNSSVVASIDAGLCRLFAWNVNYHPRNVVERFRARQVFLVLAKDG